MLSVCTWLRGTPVAALLLLQAQPSTLHRDLSGTDPPRIVVSPGDLTLTVAAGSRTAHSVTIENRGGSDLDFAVSARRRAGTSSPVSGIPRVLILESGADVSEIRGFLEAFGDFGSVHAYDVRTSTPSLSFLLSYSSVVVVANRPFADPVLLGNVLAGYADRGGGVVLTLASFLEGWEIRGKLVSGGLMPFDLGTGPIGTATLTSPASSHPIMTHVDSAWAEIIGRVKVARDAVRIGSWDVSIPLAATVGGNVAALNVYVGGEGFWTGDVARLLRNAVLFTSGIVPWLSVRPISGTVPPGESVEVGVTVDASDLDAGNDEAVLVVSSQDPDRPSVVVPVRLHVEGTPSLVVTGEDVAVESVRTYAASGPETFHDLAVDLPHAVGGSIELVVTGDYNNEGEIATARAENFLLGTVGRTGVCGSASRTFPLSPARLRSLAADGTVRVDVLGSGMVDAFCPVNRHVVRLRYGSDVERVAFGTLYVGASRETVLAIHNAGTDTLEVSSIASDAAEFSPSLTSMSLPPRGRVSLRLAFAPRRAGAFAGTLRLTSNDPATPVLALPLLGAAIEPPILEVRPAELAATLLEGRRETRTVTLSNAGGSPLDVSLRLRGRPGSPVSRNRCEFSSAIVIEQAGSAREVDLATGVLREVASDLSVPFGVAFDPGSGIAYVTEYFEGELSAVDLASGATTVVARGLDTPVGVILDADARTAFVVEAEPGRLSAIDLVSGQWGPIAGGLSHPTYAAFGSARTVYVTESDTGEISAVNLITGEVTALASGLDQPRGLAVDPVRGVVYVCEFARGTLVSVDLATGEQRVLAAGLEGPFTVALDPSGERAFVAEARGGKISRVDLEDGSVSSIASGLSFPVDLSALGARDCLGGFLEIDPVASSIPPLGSESVLVSFDPVELPGGRYEIDVEVGSNDPATPALAVPIVLTVLGAPHVEVAPPQLEVTVPRGERGSGSLRVCNRGVEPLDFALRVEPPWAVPMSGTRSPAKVVGRGSERATRGVLPDRLDARPLPSRPPRWLAVSPASASLSPARCADIAIVFDAAAAPIGDSVAGIAVSSNDPDEPVIWIPAVLHVPYTVAGGSE